MESETLWSLNYPGIMEIVYSPRWYITGHPDEYSKKILASKREDLVEYFKPHIENLIKELKSISLLGEFQLVTIIPNSRSSYSPTLESIGLWLASSLNSKFEKIIVPLKTRRKNQNCSNADERYKESFESMEVSRRLGEKESAILIIDDMKASGNTILESIKILRANGARIFYVICLGINHNPVYFGE